MPSIAAATVSPTSSKKRRRGDDSLGFELQMKVSSTHHPRRPYESTPLHYDPELTPDLQAYHRHILSPKRRPHDSKRQRIGGHLDRTKQDMYFAFEPRADTTTELHDDTMHVVQRETPRASAIGAGSGKIDLRPCHVCRRKPTVKSELDAFGDCQCCGERTCYICMRKCEGAGVMWRASIRANQGFDADCMVVEDACHDEMLGTGMGHKAEDESGARLGEKEGGRRGHRDQICSACCEERGSDGEIWCLGCLRAEEAG